MSIENGTLLERLELLAERRPDIFGASDHGFELNPPLADADVAEFERRHGIALPEQYRWFITTIGNGGVGPHYGVFALGEMDEDDEVSEWREEDGFVGALSRPFPHVEPWNDLNGKPPAELAEADEDRYQAGMDAFEKRYFEATNMNGAIPVCHMGCALRVWLVVTGPERGHVWFDRRADYEGVEPILNDRGEPATFLEWYEEWLRTALEEPSPRAHVSIDVR